MHGELCYGQFVKLSTHPRGKSMVQLVAQVSPAIRIAVHPLVFPRIHTRQAGNWVLYLCQPT
jgi:hypothetical protein